MSLPGAVSLTKVAVEGEGTATPGPPPLLLRPPQPIGGRLCPRALPRGVRTLSARPSRCSHCSHFSSSSSFLAMHSRYLACIVAMPSSTSCRRCFASSRILCVTSRSSWASRKACCGRRKQGQLSRCPWGSPGPHPWPQAYPALTRLGSTALATKWYLCMARTHWQMEVQALDTLAMAAGWNSSLSMYGWMALITASPMLSWGWEPWAWGHFPGRTERTLGGGGTPCSCLYAPGRLGNKYNPERLARRGTSVSQDFKEYNQRFFLPQELRASRSDNTQALFKTHLETRAASWPVWR